MAKIGSFFVLLFSISFSSIEAQILISGQVLDRNTHLPLSGAIITDTEGVEQVISEKEGRFEFLLKGSAIQVQHLGYKTQVRGDLQDEVYYIFLMEPDTLMLTPVVFRGEAAKQLLRLPAAFSKIDPLALERDNDLILTEALNRVPGLYMQSGALNTNRITIRGVGNRSLFGTAKIRAYLGDIPLTNGVGETSLEDIDRSILGRVDVWRGPTASIYGAGLGGMIQLQARNISWDGLELSNQFSLGSYGLWRNVINLGYRKGEAQQWQIGYNRTHSDGYRDNNTYDRAGWSVLGQLGPATDRTTILLNTVDAKAFIPSSLNQMDFENNPQAAAPNWAATEGFEDYRKILAGVSHRHRFWSDTDGKHLDGSVGFFLNQRENFERRPFNVLRENSLAVGLRATAEYRFGNRERPNISLGAEVYQERYTWQTNKTLETGMGALLSDNFETRNYYNLFAETNWDLGQKWFLTAGANFNHTRYEYEDRYTGDSLDPSGNYRFEPIFSPRISLGFRPASRVSVFGTVSHGFSPPSLEETLTPEGALNPEIQPEKGWNFELGSRGSYLWGKLHYDLAIFHMRVSDLLVARRLAEDQFVGLNAGRTIHNGLELSLNYEYSEHLFFWANYAFSDYTFDKFVDGENDYSGNALTGAPPHRFTAGMDVRLPSIGLYGFLNYEFTDAFPIRDDNSVYSDSYQVVNLKLGWQGQVLHFDQGPALMMDIFAGLNNLLNERYASQILINASSFGGAAPRYYYPGLPRNWYSGVKLSIRY